ncbi:YesL family protein [Sedimentibacter sp.]|uniref:YesL family protein n=1 Tax=Sedimentibacter sp. TaxID=1960295 RepID=UPI00289F420B|nr:YesL family protein [Sedimentibacter sp.]
MFFKSYYNPGPGIDKNAPPKKGLALYIELITVDFWGFISLNMLYVICCLPVLTIGGATIAYTELCCKLLRREHVFVFSDFFGSFRNNFKKGILLSLVLLLVLFDLLIIYTNAVSYIDTELSAGIAVFWAIAGILSILLTSLIAYLVPIIANLELDFLFQLKNAFILTIIGSWRTLAVSAFNMISFILFFTLFPFSGIVFFIIGFYILIFTNCFFTWPLIEKHVVLPPE